MSTHTQKIPYFGNHGAIVVGKGGSTAKALKGEFNLSILHAFRDDDGSQYFIIKGVDERGVNHAAIRVQGLLLASMARKEQKQIEALDAERCYHEETRDKLMVAELKSVSAFPSLGGTPIATPPQKKVSFAPLVECRRQVNYPCEINN